jgi:hypothetical protein
LATIATENPNHRCFKADGPEELLSNWNPEENFGKSIGFFWIDDAFGPNQMRDDFVDRWISIMPKVQAAVASNNAFVLTSRRHIYEAAKVKLGSRNHPLFRSGDAVVDVGALTREERQMILYNHLKAGGQSRSWKAQTKPYLDELCDVPTFLPEIARRFSDPSYTKHLAVSRDALTNFFANPKEHLIQTIAELSGPHRAALTLVFLHRGQMPVGDADASMQKLVETHFSASTEALGQALQQLHQSFLIQKELDGRSLWTFKHPTISDAVAAMLSATDGMRALYLGGVSSDVVLTELVCSSVNPIQDAIAIPQSLDQALAKRLIETPDDPRSNYLLFSFFDRRATDNVFKLCLTADNSILQRASYAARELGYDPKILAIARAFRLGLLSDDVRRSVAERLEAALFDKCDTSFLNKNDVMALFMPSQVIQFGLRIRNELLERIPDIACSISEDPDLDIDPEDNVERLRTAIAAFEDLFDGDHDAIARLRDVESAIDDAVSVIDRKRDHAFNGDHDDDDGWDWDNYSNPPPLSPRRGLSEVSTTTKTRSIFSDVDE